MVVNGGEPKSHYIGSFVAVTTQGIMAEKPPISEVIIAVNPKTAIDNRNSAAMADIR